MPQRSQKLHRWSSDDAKNSRVVFLFELPGSKTSEAGRHDSLAGESLSSFPSVVMLSWGMHAAAIISSGVSSQKGTMEPVAVRQSLQRSVQTMGMWTCGDAVAPPAG